MKLNHKYLKGMLELRNSCTDLYLSCDRSCQADQPSNLSNSCKLLVDNQDAEQLGVVHRGCRADFTIREDGELDWLEEGVVRGLEGEATGTGGSLEEGAVQVQGGQFQTPSGC